MSSGPITPRERSTDNPLRLPSNEEFLFEPIDGILQSRIAQRMGELNPTRTTSRVTPPVIDPDQPMGSPSPSISINIGDREGNESVANYTYDARRIDADGSTIEPSQSSMNHNISGSNITVIDSYTPGTEYGVTDMARNEISFYDNSNIYIHNDNLSVSQIYKPVILSYDAREIIRIKYSKVIHDLVQQGDKRSIKLMLNKLDINKGWIQIDDYKKNDTEFNGQGNVFIVTGVNLSDEDHDYNVGDLILCNSEDVRVTKLTDKKTNGGNLFISIKTEDVVGRLRI